MLEEDDLVILCIIPNTQKYIHAWWYLNMSLSLYKYAHQCNCDKYALHCFYFPHAPLHTHGYTYSCLHNPFHITILLPITFWIHWVQKKKKEAKQNRQKQASSANTIGHACLWIQIYKNSVRSVDHGGFVSYTVICSPSVVNCILTVGEYAQTWVLHTFNFHK